MTVRKIQIVKVGLARQSTGPNEQEDLLLFRYPISPLGNEPIREAPDQALGVCRESGKYRETAMWEIWADVTPATRARCAHSQRPIPFHFINWPPRASSSLLVLRVLHFYDRTRFSVDSESSSVHGSYWMDRTTAKNAMVPPSPTICQESR